MKKIAILGLGDILQGDRGAACYVLESVAGQTVGRSVQIAYLGDNSTFAGGVLYKTDLAIVVGTLDLSGIPGGLHVWNGKVFKQHESWLAGEDPAIGGLLGALAKTDLAGGFPRKLIFIWIEPQYTQGYHISKPVRRAIAMAVKRIRRELMAIDWLDRAHHRGRAMAPSYERHASLGVPMDAKCS